MILDTYIVNYLGNYHKKIYIIELKLKNQFPP